MKKLLIIPLVIAFVFIALFVINLKKESAATIRNKTFKLLVASSQEQKENGLSKRAYLRTDYGMLFPFDRPDYHAFWMKDMKFPIDIIFIRDSRIIEILENAAPPKSSSESLTVYKPKERADAVLEINSGLSKKYHFKSGDLVTIKSY